jgi:hypothetical protein
VLIVVFLKQNIAYLVEVKWWVSARIAMGDSSFSRK